MSQEGGNLHGKFCLWGHILTDYYKRMLAFWIARPLQGPFLIFTVKLKIRQINGFLLVRLHGDWKEPRICLWIAQRGNSVVLSDSTVPASFGEPAFSSLP